jgi:hypothetical protein
MMLAKRNLTLSNPTTIPSDDAEYGKHFLQDPVPPLDQGGLMLNLAYDLHSPSTFI